MALQAYDLVGPIFLGTFLAMVAVIALMGKLRLLFVGPMRVFGGRRGKCGLPKGLCMCPKTKTQKRGKWSVKRKVRGGGKAGCGKAWVGAGHGAGHGAGRGAWSTEARDGSRASATKPIRHVRFDLPPTTLAPSAAPTGMPKPPGPADYDADDLRPSDDLPGLAPVDAFPFAHPDLARVDAGLSCHSGGGHGGGNYGGHGGGHNPHPAPSPVFVGSLRTSSAPL